MTHASAGLQWLDLLLLLLVLVLVHDAHSTNTVTGTVQSAKCNLKEKARAHEQKKKKEKKCTITARVSFKILINKMQSCRKTRLKISSWIQERQYTGVLRDR